MKKTYLVETHYKSNILKYCAIVPQIMNKNLSPPHHLSYSKLTPYLLGGRHNAQL